MNNWNIQALESTLAATLAACHTDSERLHAEALHGREVRRLAWALAREGRLTPGGRAIAERYGFPHIAEEPQS